MPYNHVSSLIRSIVQGHIPLMQEIITGLLAPYMGFEFYVYIQILIFSMKIKKMSIHR